MPPLNFERLKVFVESVKDDEALENLEDSAADEWFEQLSQFEVENESDISRVSLLFSAAKTIMEYKDLQYSAIMQQAAESEKDAATREEDFQEKNQKLQEEISNLRMNMTAGTTGLEIKALRDEIESLREENEGLKYDERERLRELADAQNQADRYLSQITDLEKEVKDLRDERFDLMNRNDELNRRWKAYEEGQDGSRSHNEQLQRRMQELRSQLLSQVDELTNLTKANETLKNQVDKLKEDLTEATSQMQITTDQNLRLKEVLREADYTIERLKQDLSESKNQPGDGSGSKNELEALVVAVDKKIEHWKELLRKKDEEKELLKQEVERMKREITEYSIDTDRTSVAALTKAVDDRDRQIASFKLQLERGTQEMQEMSDLVESLQSQLTSGGSASSAAKKRMADMVLQARQSSTLVAEANERAEKAERTAVNRDKELADLVSRLRQYEQGVYGLPEAVDEIKHLKEQIGIRDGQIGQLNQRCSEVQIDMHETSEENDELRDRLGLNKRVKIQRSRQKGEETKQETERAINIILQKEVDKLEDERIDLKIQIRKLSQKLGQKAVALGLSADDVLIIEDFTEELKNRRESAMDKLKHLREKKDSVDHHQDSHSGIDSTVLSTLQKENTVLKANNAQLGITHKLDEQFVKHQVSEFSMEWNPNVELSKRDNRKLSRGLQYMKEELGQADPKLLESVVGSLEDILTKPGSSEMGEMSQDLQFRQLEATTQGRLEEARLELQNIQDHLLQTKIDLRAAEGEVSKLEEALKDAKEDNSGETLGVLQLPDGLPQTSSMLIMNLNERLIQLLQESELREAECSKLESALGTSQSKIGVLKHFQGLCMQEFREARESWEQEKGELEHRCKSMQEYTDQTSVTVAHYKTLCDTLEKDENEVKRRIGEMSRKFTVMQINEKIMGRKYRDLENIEHRLRQEQLSMRKELLRMESNVKEKMGYFLRQKEISNFQLSSLHKQSESSVPLKQFKLKESELEDLAGKYRKLMDENMKLSKVTRKDAETDVLLQKYQKESVYLKKLVQAEKQRCALLEASGNHSLANGMRRESERNIGMSERMGMLEMKELNERERAEHAQNMYESQKKDLNILEDRNMILERKVEELGHTNLELQKAEQSLRDELQGCVPESVDAANRKRIDELTASEAELRAEMQGLKMMADVAKSQSAHWQRVDRGKDTELQELRLAVRDLQSQSDEKSIIARLHRDLIHLKLNDTDTEEKLEVARGRLADLEARLLKAQQLVDHKESQIHNLTAKFIYRLGQARDTISALRTRFSGAISLREQETMQRQLQRMNDDRRQITSQLIHSLEEAEEAEERLQQMKMAEKGVEELTAALKSGDPGKKLAQWHDKLEAVRLSEMKLTRKLNKIKNKYELSQAQVNSLEADVGRLEAENVALVKDFEAREIQWEMREVDLENQLHQHRDASQWEEKQLIEAEFGSYGLPDPSLPLADQLEMALRNVRQQIKANSSLRTEVKNLERRLDESDQRRKEVEVRVRSRLYQSEDFHPAGYQPESAESSRVSAETRNELQHTLSAAEAVVESLRAQVKEKENTVETYKSLLDSAKRELHDIEVKHQAEMRDLRSAGQTEVQDRLKKMKLESDALVRRLNQPDTEENQLMKIAELEDTVVEQENAITSLVERMKNQKTEKDAFIQAKMEEIQSFQQQLRAGSGGPLIKEEKESQKDKDELNKDYAEDFDEELDSHEEKETFPLDQPELFRHPKRASIPQDRSLEHKRDSEDTSRREPNRRISKASTVRTSVTPKKGERSIEQHSLQWKVKHDRMKKVAEELKAENQGLSRALLDLKSSHQASTRMGDAETGLVELELKDLKLKVEELEEKCERQKGSLSKAKDREEELMGEVQDQERERERKDGTIRKLKQDKAALEKETESLERRITHLRESMKYKILESENRELKKKVAVLEKHKRNGQRITAEKPYEDSSEKDVVPRVTKWEESKKWQRIAEKAKEKLLEKTKEADESQILIERLRQRISRLEQEKVIALKGKATGATLSPEKKPMPHSTRDNQRISQLESENRDLRSELSRLKIGHERVSQGSAVEGLEAENLRLQEQCAVLEKRHEELFQSANSALRFTPKYSAMVENSESIKDLETVIGLLRRVLTECQNENSRLEAKVKVMEAHKDSSTTSTSDRQEELIQALKSDIEMLQDENESLKEELEEASSRPGIIETINRQHATIERLEGEKRDLCRQLDELNLSSSRISDLDVQKIVKENKELREKVSRQAPRVAWAEEFRAETSKTTERVSGKLVTENHRLSRELRKEQVENLSLKQELWSVKESADKLQAEVQRLQNLHSQKRKWSPGAFSARVLEEQLKAKESMLEFKENRIVQLEGLLREEVDKCHTYLFENKRMKEKIQAYEWMPATKVSQSEDSITELRNIKAQQGKAAAENLELRAELEVVNRYMKPLITATNEIDMFMVKERLKNYDRVLKENIELKLQCYKL